MKMRDLAIVFCVVLTGCDQSLSRQEIIAAKKECEAAGMHPMYLTRPGNQEIIEAQCAPFVTPGSEAPK